MLGYSFVIASVLNSASLARSSEQSTLIHAPCMVHELPGVLNNVYVFNSNSPEIVKQPGILLSTFPPKNKKVPFAHLNFAFKGRFDLFAHHLNSQIGIDKTKTLYICALVNNPSNHTVRLRILQAASYLSLPDAPFIKLNEMLENPQCKIYSGPGDRVMTEFLFGKTQKGWPKNILLRAGETKILFNLPIYVKSLKPALNGRSTLMQLSSNGPVYLATLAMFVRNDHHKNEQAPSLDQWQKLLIDGSLAGPREKMATAPNNIHEYVTGRVAGVQRGDLWQAYFADYPGNKNRFTIPQPGKAVCFPISTLDGGTFGTQQVQSAPLVVRYPDTAYKAYGNYGVQYNLTIPLYNSTGKNQTVSLKLQTPVKSDRQTNKIAFLKTASDQIFFRGTLQLSYRNDKQVIERRYIHLVQKRGEQGDPLFKLELHPKETRLLKIRFFYPPDSTPPQILTIETTRQIDRQ